MPSLVTPSPSALLSYCSTKVIPKAKPNEDTIRGEQARVTLGYPVEDEDRTERQQERLPWINEPPQEQAGTRGNGTSPEYLDKARLITAADW